MRIRGAAGVTPSSLQTHFFVTHEMAQAHAEDSQFFSEGEVFTIPSKFNLKPDGLGEFADHAKKGYEDFQAQSNHLHPYIQLVALAMSSS